MVLLLLCVAGLVTAAALVSWVGRRGVELSAENRYYGQCFELLGLRTGHWKELPPVAGVTLKLYSHMDSGPAPSRNSWATWDASGVRYQKLVLLPSLQGSATGLVLREFGTDELAAARQAAQELAARFGGVPVREYLMPRPGRRR